MYLKPCQTSKVEGFGYGPVIHMNKRIEFIFTRNEVITREHICTNSNLKVYKFLAETDPETLLHLRGSSLLLESVDHCHKELHLFIYLFSLHLKLT